MIYPTSAKALRPVCNIRSFELHGNAIKVVIFVYIIGIIQKRKTNKN